MKYLLILITTLAAAALAVGCKPSEQTTSAPPSPDSAAQRYEQMKKETKEATQAAKDYAYAQRAEYADQMKAEIARLDAEMEQLGQKIESSSSAAKDEAKARLQACRDKSATLNKKLDEVRNASENTWDEVKSGFKKGYDELKTSFDEARQWLSRKLST